MQLGSWRGVIWRPTLSRPSLLLAKRWFGLSRVRAAEQLHDDSIDIARTRNIGIIAHIDAVGQLGCINSNVILIFTQGKTTTTERMLYYSGHTRRIGSM